MREFSLIARTERGELDFPRLVEVLASRGYVTDLEHEPGLSFNRPSMNQVSQEDFDFLFGELCPGKKHKIELSVFATDEGGARGCFSYAIFNLALVDFSVINKILIEGNRRIAREFLTDI